MLDREQRLTEVLSEFARTMLTDFPIQRILDHLVERIVDVLPIAAAGVTLMSAAAEQQLLAASDDRAMTLERMQARLGDGPCVLAHREAVAVGVPDLARDPRFPVYAGAAADVGLAAVFAFPLRHVGGSVGALDVFVAASGPLEPWAVATAQTLADVTCAYVLNARAREDSRRAAEQLREMSLHDPLTGLPNRVLLQQRLDHAAERARRTHAPAAVLFADLDAFKQVNDTYGHPVGDAVLIAVAGRLNALLRPGDTLARVSGDEFVVLCEDLATTGDVDAVATRIGEAFRRPFVLTMTGAEVERLELTLTASVGIAFSGRADDIGSRLIQDADLAMYQAKRKGGARAQVIDLPEAARAADRRELEHDLRSALGRGELTLAYQPIVALDGDAVTGVEALVRWTHPRRGPLPATTIVELAEQSPLMLAVGEWVLERAMRDRCDWLEQVPHLPMTLAVNVSGRQLLTPGLPATVARLLRTTGMDPAALTLEMTESIFLDDATRAVAVLAELRALGVQIALDDFGTGYSSLSYLRQFPVDTIKIDQEFVAAIGVEPAGAAIVAAIAGLAHALGLCVTAEGVETVEQRDAVAAVGCQSAQGFLYAEPMPAAAVLAHLRSSPAGPLVLHGT